MGAILTEAESVALRPLEKLTSSQWAEKFRVLPDKTNAESGPLNLNRTPYTRGISDCAHEPGVEEIVFVKPTQVGGSTTVETFIGYAIDRDPGPMLHVLPNEEAARKVVKQRIRPLITTEPLKSHLSGESHDNTLVSIEFDTCPYFIAWAGSPAALASSAIRYVIFDEVDKYPRSTGKEADPISLGMERTRTFGYRRKVFIISTPTVRSGAIWRAWEAAGDKRRFHCPCPHCGKFQFLVFGQIKWPKQPNLSHIAAADAIEQQGLATYECIHCRQAILNSDRLKMIARGVWLSETQTIDHRGVISGERPRAKRVGFWINAIYSPWLSFSNVAAEFLRSLADPLKMQNFKNSWLAEVFEDVVKTSSVDDFRKLLVGAPKAMIVPRWAEYLVASADVQADRIYFAVRAWGGGYRSRLITYGIASTFAELRQRTLETPFQVEGGESGFPHLLTIDARHRTVEVYEFATTHERIRAVMGGNDEKKMLVTRSTAGDKWGISLHLLNTQLLKDRLSILRGSKRWELNDAVEEDYLTQLASEHKILVAGVEMWVPKTKGQPNHRLDVEVYSLAGAEILEVYDVPVAEGGDS